MNAHFRNLALWAIIGLLVVALVMLFQQLAAHAYSRHLLQRAVDAD